MSDLSIKENRTIVIKKNKGITHALKKLVTDNKNSIISDGKITAKEWNATLDKLIEINNSRKANNQKPIFTGGTDKSRAGWHSSFVVHPEQKIEFTQEEMGALLSAMGVTFKNTTDEKTKDEQQNPAEKNSAANSDSTKVKPSAAQDSTEIETIPALDADSNAKKEIQTQTIDTIPAKTIPTAANDSIKKTPAPDSTKTAVRADNDSIKNQPAVTDSIKNVPTSVQDSIAQPAAADSVKENIVSRPADASTASVSETVEQEKSRYELSWGEIGGISLKSAKNFVKNMFCDENGFSLKRTAMTVGLVAGLALAPTTAAKLGAKMNTVRKIGKGTKIAGFGLAGYMAYNGGKNAIQGGKKYYESTTKEEAEANMEQAMDGAVELTAAIPAFLTIKGGANKGNKIAAQKGEAKPSTPEPPSEGVKPDIEIKPADGIKPTEEPIPTPEVKPAEEPNRPEFEFDFSVPEEKVPAAETNPSVEIKPELEIKPTEEGKIPAETPEVEVPKPEPATATETKPVPEVKPAEERVPAAETTPANEVKPQENAKPETKPAEPAPEVKPADEKVPANEVKPQNSEKPVDYNEISDKPEIIKTLNGGKIERYKNTDGNTVKDVSYDKNGKLSYTQEIYYGVDGTEAGYRIEWADGKIDEFIAGSSTGVRQYPNGTEYKIRREGSKIIQGDEIKPQKVEPKQPEQKPETSQIEQPQPSGEVKPAEESAPEIKPTQETTEPKNATKPEAKPAQGASKAENASNKVFRSEIDKSPDGSTREYFYNKDGKIIKNIKRDKNGEFKSETISEYNSQGQQTKRSYRNADNDICENLFKDGSETKKTWKWADGMVDELKAVEDGIYEGVRTYPDGRKVKIRVENYETSELGPVE